VILWAVVILYVLTGACFITYLFWRRRPVVLIARGMFLASIALHILLTLSLTGPACRIPLVSPVQAVNMMVLLASVVFIFFAFRGQTAVLGAFFLPVAAVALGMTAPGLQAGGTTTPVMFQAWHSLHTVSVVAGEALFAVAFVVSVVYLIHENIIRKGRIHWTAAGLPPLRLLDRILSVCLGAGFVAITAGMLFGALWASSLGVGLSQIAMKISAGAAIWLVFAFSIHQRFAIRWSGRRTALITIAGFLIMIILFVGVNLVYPGAHGAGLAR